MRIAALAALLITALLVAGCTGGASGATARQGYAQARSAATSWDSDAVLVGVVALEEMDVENATREFEQEIAQDGAAGAAVADEIRPLFKALLADGDLAPGDGLAPAWGYLFYAPSGLRVVVVDAYGSVTYNRNWNLPGFDEMPQGLEEGWTIDSDEAARVAAGENQALRAAMASPEASSTTSLGTYDTKVAWMVMVGGDQEPAMVWVDAGSGKVLDSYPRGGVNQPRPTPQPVPAGLDQEADMTTGTLTAAVSDSETYNFRVSDTHESMQLMLEATDTIGAVELTATVRDPMGNEQTLRVNGVGLAATFSMPKEVESPAEGEWAVTIALEQGAQQDYRFSWCTDGEPEPSNAENPACSAYR